MARLDGSEQCLPRMYAMLGCVGLAVTLSLTKACYVLQLWEWDAIAADAATRIHDQIVRSTLISCCGHEISTEG